jgi:hypothetical protein
MAADGKVQQTGSVNFPAEVSDRQWRVRTEDAAVLQGGKRGPDFVESGCDGLDVFQLMHFSDQSANKLTRPGARNETGFVSPGLFPQNELIFGRIAWLAFASGLTGDG